MQISSELPETFQRRWPSIHSLIEVAFERRVKGETYCDSREYMSPLPLDTEAAAKAIRQHWGIENELHWTLDVTFREDELSLKDPDGTAHMALFNRIALNMLKD